MCNDSNGSPLVVRWIQSEPKGREVVTLEELYMKCVKKRTRLKKGQDIDTLLKSMGVVLRKECYNRLAALLKDGARVGFIEECIRRRLSPFGVRMAVYNSPTKGKNCYWPECPTP